MTIEQLLHEAFILHPELESYQPFHYCYYVANNGTVEYCMSEDPSVYANFENRVYTLEEVIAVLQNA